MRRACSESFLKNPNEFEGFPTGTVRNKFSNGVSRIAMDRER